MMTAVYLLPSLGSAQAQGTPRYVPLEEDEANARVLWIGLVNGTEAEAVAAAELRALMRKYDLEPWILMRRVLIDESQIPYAGPILSLNTAENGEELGLLSDFLHEQFHYLADEPWLSDLRAAEQDFATLFPEVPAFADGGGLSDEATYNHLLVCDLEYHAMTALVGEAGARETLAGINHYQWIYEKVLNDPRVREVALRHGFDVSKGVPKR
jgi:hypothetical protein